MLSILSLIYPLKIVALLTCRSWSDSIFELDACLSVLDYDISWDGKCKEPTGLEIELMNINMVSNTKKVKRVQKWDPTQNW